MAAIPSAAQPNIDALIAQQAQQQPPPLSSDWDVVNRETITPQTASDPAWNVVAEQPVTAPRTKADFSQFKNVRGPITTRNVNIGIEQPESPETTKAMPKRQAELVTGLAQGKAAGVVGPFFGGDIEALGRAGLAKAGVPVATDTTILPTTESVGTHMFGKPVSEEQARARAAGNLLGPLAASKVFNTGAKLAARTVAGAGPTYAASIARQAGYVLPPVSASEKPGVVSQGLSMLSGKIKLGQAASAKNEQVSTVLAARAVGLPEDAPITEAALERVRHEAGQAYEAVRRAPVELIADGGFKKRIASIDDIGAAARAEVPELVSNPEIDNLVAALSGKERLSPDAAVDLVRSLRYKAQTNLKNYSSPEKMALGRAQSKAAAAVEDLIDRNLSAATTARQPIGAQGGDMSALVSQLQQARETIAKTYDIEDALNPATGIVDANKIAALAAKGKPLTGELKQIADFAAAFPKAAQSAAKFGGEEKLSIMDLGAAALSGGWSIPLSLARPAARRLVLSPSYQNFVMRAPGAASSRNYANRIAATAALPLPNALRPENPLYGPVKGAR